MVHRSELERVLLPPRGPGQPWGVHMAVPNDPMTLCVRERQSAMHQADEAVVARGATDCEKCLAWAADFD